MYAFPNSERDDNFCSDTGKLIVVVHQCVIFVTYSASLDAKVPINELHLG
jgi:hypothetical protein